MAINKYKFRRVVVEVLKTEFGDDLEAIYLQHTAYRTSDFNLAVVLNEESYYTRPTGSKLIFWLEGEEGKNNGFKHKIINRYSYLVKSKPYPMEIGLFLLNESTCTGSPVVNYGEMIYQNTILNNNQ